MWSDGLGGNSPKRAFGSSHAKMQSADCADCVYFPIFYHDCFGSSDCRSECFFHNFSGINLQR